MRSMRGMPFVSNFTLESSSEISSVQIAQCPDQAGAFQIRLKPDRPGDAESQRRVNSRDPVIGHDSQAAGKRFGLPRGKRFPDIKDTKKYKAQQQIFPVGQDHHARAERVATPQDGVAVRRNACGLRVPGPEATEEEGELLPGDFIDYYSLRVLGAPIFCCSIRRPDPDQCHSHCQQTLNKDKRVQSERPKGNVSHPYSSKRPHAEEHEPKREHRQGNTCQRAECSWSTREIAEPECRRDRERDAGLAPIGSRRAPGATRRRARGARAGLAHSPRSLPVPIRPSSERPLCIFPWPSSRGRARGSGCRKRETPEMFPNR